MKFIHCADIHLDSKIAGIPSEKSKTRREEILRTFEKLCEYATDNEITAVIIAGDMFDTGRVSIKTKERVMQAIRKNEKVDFLYLSGNHDEENFICSIDDKPCNLKVFGDDWTTFEYGKVKITGTEINSNNVKTLYETLSLDDSDVNVVVLHGQVVGHKGEEKAEIINVPKLKDKNIDYLALGHIHSHASGDIDQRGKYAYSGCLDGRGFDEIGEKGFVLLEIEDKKVTDTFIKFSSREIHEFTFNLDEDLSWYAFADKIFDQVTKSCSGNSLVKITITGEHKLDYFIDTESLLSKLGEWFFFAKIYDRTNLLVKVEDFESDKTVKGEFVRAVYSSDLDQDLKNKIIICGIKALKGEEI